MRPALTDGYIIFCAIIIKEDLTGFSIIKHLNDMKTCTIMSSL